MMKNKIHRVLISSLIISGLVTPIQALSPQKKLASFVNQLKNEVYQFKKCFTKGENCDPKRKKIYKTIAAIVGILAVAIVIRTGFHFRPKKKQTKKENGAQKKSQERDFSTLSQEKSNEQLNAQLIDAVYKSNDLTLVQKLLGEGADPNAKDKYKRNAFKLAVNKGYKEIVKVLLADERITNATINAQYEDGINAFITAADRGDLEIANALLADKRITEKTINAQDDSGANALMWATRWGHKEIVKLLLADERITEKTINAQDNVGRNALFWATTGNDKEILKALLANKNITKETIRKARSLTKNQEIIQMLKDKLKEFQ